MKPIFIILLSLLLFTCKNPNQKLPSYTRSQDGTQIHFTLYGSGQPAVVLVHGWCIDQTYWDQTVDSLKEDHEVLTIDLAGHGLSDTTRGEYTMEAYAQDVLAAMDATDITKAILVGHSMASSVILEVNRQAPDRVVGLIGIDNFKNLGTVYNDSLKDKYDEAMAKMKKDYEGFNRSYVDQYLFPKEADSAAKARVFQSILNTNHRVAANTLKNLWVFSAQEQMLAQDLTHKLYLVECTYLPTDTAALHKYAGHGYQIYTISGTGHYPMIETPGEFAKQLKKAIAAIEDEKEESP